jgi:hypothetical protein
MAGETGFGMEKGQLKALLIKSKKEPVSCAIGKGKEAGSAYILLDKIKQPKALETALEKQFPDIKDPRRGTASVDVDDNPKLVVFRLNKPASGMAVRMLKLVKQVGFSKVKFEYEDGSEAEGLGDEEEEGAESGSEEISTSNTAVPPAPPPPPPSAPPVDAKALKERLTALVQRMAQVIGADPSRKDALMALAKQAQLMLGTNNLMSTAQSTDELEAALASAPVTGAPPGKTEAQKPAPSDPATYAKSRLAWLAVRKKMETDLDTLRKEILAYYKDQDIASDLDARYAKRVAPVLTNLDEALADTLEMATNAPDPTQRTKLVIESRQIIKRYQDFMASDAIFGELDSNPFVPLTITKTLTATLQTLSAAVR